MTKKKLLIIALILFILGLIFATGTYFMFHYLTKANKFGSTFQTTMQKPVVTCVAAGAATLFTIESVTLLLFALINPKK